MGFLPSIVARMALFRLSQLMDQEGDSTIRPETKGDRQSKTTKGASHVR
jgi:hypothetical protein